MVYGLGGQVQGGPFFLLIWITYKHTDKHTHVHTHIHRHMHTTLPHTHAYTHTHRYPCTHIHSHTHTQTHIHAHLPHTWDTHTHTYTPTHTGTLIHTYIHTYAHTYTRVKNITYLVLCLRSVNIYLIDLPYLISLVMDPKASWIRWYGGDNTVPVIVIARSSGPNSNSCTCCTTGLWSSDTSIFNNSQIHPFFHCVSQW